MELRPCSYLWIFILILTLVKRTSSQAAWIAEECECEQNAPPWATFSLVAINSWSACKDWSEQDRENTGCYSGVQERSLRCLYRSMEGLNGAEINKLNALVPLCLERRRCLAQGRACEGYWGHWANNGPCNCIKKERTQSRYCYKKSEGWGNEDKVIVSIHCIGSNGNIEQNRTIKCSSRECPNIPAKPTPGEPSTRAEAASSLTTAITTTRKNTTVSAKATLASTEGTASPLSKETLIVAGVAVGIAFFAALMLVVMCLMRKRQDKKVENNNYSQPVPPAPLPPNGAYMSPGVIPNSLYSPYVHANGDVYNSPHPGYMTQPSPARRTLSARLAQHPILPIGQRDRSATMGVLWHEYDTAIRDNAPNRRLRNSVNLLRRSAILSSPIREGPYAVPIDHTAHDDEIYWSIDDAGPLRQVQHGSHPNIQSHGRN